MFGRSPISNLGWTKPMSCRTAYQLRLVVNAIRRDHPVGGQRREGENPRKAWIALDHANELKRTARTCCCLRAREP